MYDNPVYHTLTVAQKTHHRKPGYPQLRVGWFEKKGAALSVVEGERLHTAQEIKIADGMIPIGVRVSASAVLYRSVQFLASISTHSATRS